MTPQSSEPQPTSGPLVDGEWLEANLDRPNVRILDVRGRHPSSPLAHAKSAEYAEAHIPGAVFVDWEHDFVDIADPVPYQIASPSAFAARASALGIGDDDVVITYDDYYGIFAARVAWSFRFYGAEARVLDGGWRTWVEQQRPTTAHAPQPSAATFTPRPRQALRRDLHEVEVATAAGVTLVDARPRHLYLGEPGVAGTGHIPGALSLPYQELVDGATGLFATPAAIRRLLRGAGIDPERPPRELIATCGTGVSATVALMALELAGVQGAGVYDGSFSEWSADPARPIEYGAAGSGNHAKRG
jgi:thiosulfate/3-mercaptopyruvate sulfurtransferase